MTTTEGATLLAAVLAGGAISQMPIGRISDMVDRRLVMIVCGLVGVVSAVVLSLFGPNHIYIIYAAGFMTGSVLYPVYALNAAHANDRAGPDEFVSISSSIMILYGLGTVSGPVMGGALMETVGPRGLMWFIALSFALYSGHAVYRMMRRATDDRDSATDFHAMPLPMQGTDGVSGTLTSNDPAP